MARDKTVNLKMLSESLGLSQTTVSRALNGFPEVAEKTRARVVEAAERLNYQPSPSAASLATGKSRQIGHVVNLSDHLTIDPHFADFIAGACEVYSAFGYELLMRVAPRHDEEKIYRDFVSRNRVDGVVLHGPVAGDKRIPLLQSLGLPFVVHGRSDGTVKDYSWLDVNNRRAFQRAAEFLIELGHRRIGLVNGLEVMNFADRRRQGYAAGLAAHGITPDDTLVFSGDMTEPHGYRSMQRLLSLAEPPTAVLVASVLPAMGVTRALGAAGHRAGADVSVIAFDDCLSFLEPGKGDLKEIPYFTAMRSSIREAGKRVAQMVLKQIDSPPGQCQHELWEADFVIGQTTAPLRVA